MAATALAALDLSSFTPYGQLLRMLVPRALGIAIHDAQGQLLWSADGQHSIELHQLVDDHLAEQTLESGAARDWCDARRLNVLDDLAYLFTLRDAEGVRRGVVLLVFTERDSAQRSAQVMLSLLRPALEVLLRELVGQNCVEALQQDLRTRDQDMALLFDDPADHRAQEADQFARLLSLYLTHLQGVMAVLLVPDKHIAVLRLAAPMSASAGSELLNRTHRHLLALAQVQRRSFMMNRAPDTGPLAAIGHKILTCPVMQGGQRVVGVLALFRSAEQPDFRLRDQHAGELLARRVAQLLTEAYDGGSGLLTRQALEQRVARALRDQRHDAHQVIYVDIDRLHLLNEMFGMQVGDAVIARAADVMRAVSSSKVAIAKISGDRFALFLQATALEAAVTLAEQLCTAIKNMGYTVGSQVVEVTASFGVATAVHSEHPLSHALASAEAACKVAKDRGRNRVAVFEDADQSVVRRVGDMGMLAALREALDHDHFRLFAQPIVALQAGDTTRKYELLLRMVDDQEQLISPAKFLAAAERYQLAPAIDRWVLGYTLEVVAAMAPMLREAGACFAVNLSGQSLSDDEFLDFIETTLQQHRQLASLISFELTETAAVSNIVRAERLMRRLRDLGHHIALDDFGKGLSSLSYLKSLPVDCVKLDGELIRDVTSNAQSQAMVSAVVQMARAMGLKTTAECIENEATLMLIKRLGVDHAQGYAIDRPKPLEDVLHDLHEQLKRTRKLSAR